MTLIEFSLVALGIGIGGLLAIAFVVVPMDRSFRKQINLARDEYVKLRLNTLRQEFRQSGRTPEREPLTAPESDSAGT